jgi:hypothetical protein
VEYLAKSAVEQNSSRAVEAAPEAESRALDPPLIKLGYIAMEYFQKYVERSGGDTTFGIYNRDGIFPIGNMPVQFDKDDLIIGDKLYSGTPGLWELIVSKDPKQYTDDDKNVCEDILVKTSTMHHNYDPNNPRPKSSKGEKCVKIVKLIRDKMKRSGH